MSSDPEVLIVYREFNVTPENNTFYDVTTCRKVSGHFVLHLQSGTACYLKRGFVCVCVCVFCFYLTTHSTHFIYGYMASDILLRTIQISREETRCRHMGYSFRLPARVLLYESSHRQDKTYHDLWYTSRGALAETRNSSMGPP